MSQHDDAEDHDLGLSHDLPKIVERSGMGRRGLLALFGGVGAIAVAGCGSDDAGSASSSVSEGEIPEETVGPYPGDASNGPDVLSESGVVRSDITSSFGSSATMAAGVPAKIRFEVVDASAGCTPLKEAAVYVWHCDGHGRYSMYSNGVTNENFLRGVQGTDTDGVLTFASLFPGCYSGRWPHIHFEVYPGV